MRAHFYEVFLNDDFGVREHADASTSTFFLFVFSSISLIKISKDVSNLLSGNATRSVVKG